MFPAPFYVPIFSPSKPSGFGAYYTRFFVFFKKFLATEDAFQSRIVNGSLGSENAPF